jgi:N-acetylglutamate synthase-like GNAT family acetyltransferase
VTDHTSPHAPSPIIRAAEPAEAETIVTLIHRAFAQYRDRLVPASAALNETRESIVALMAQGRVLLAKVNGMAVGCVAVEDKGDCIYVGRLAVEPSARGRKLGLALMDAVETEARLMGGRRLRLDCRLSLTENRAFFRALGFIEGAHRCHAGFAEPTYVELEKILI